MRIVVGLGNPGAQYEHTLHNLGFRVLDRVAGRLQLAWRAGDGDRLEASGRERGESFVLVKPMTFMNLSGAALAPFRDRGELDPKQLLVVLDDLDLPTGQIRIRATGSDGGHRGLRSIIATLGSCDVTRVRLGIGSARAGRDAADYVLDATAVTAEREALNASIDSASEAVILWLSWASAEELMNRFNRRIDSAPP